MKHDVQFFHCNEKEEVIEIEKYIEENGAIISLKETFPAAHQLFPVLRRQLEAEGWEIELAGVTRLGPHHVEVNSYVARRLHQ